MGDQLDMQPVGWRLPRELPDGLRFARMLSVPTAFRDALASLRKEARLDYSPTASLHNALGTFSTAILTLNHQVFWRDATTTDWMFTTADAQINVERCKQLVSHWARTVFSPEHARRHLESWRQSDWHWTWNEIDLARQDSATQELRRALLPGLVVRWLMAHPHYQFTMATGAGTRPVEMRLVPTLTLSHRAEWVSEPQIYSDHRLYSFVLTFWVEPAAGGGDMLYARPSLRRWQTHPLMKESSVYLPRRRGKSVYVRQRAGWLDGDGEQQPAFADVFTRLTLYRVGGSDAGLGWLGHQAALLGALRLGGTIPDAEALAQNPTMYQPGALITLQNADSGREGDHVGSGLPVADHRHVFDDLNRVIASSLPTRSLPLARRVSQGDLPQRGRSTNQGKHKDIRSATRFAALRAWRETFPPDQPPRIELHTSQPTRVKAAILTHIGAIHAQQDSPDKDTLHIKDGDTILLKIVQMHDPDLTELLPDGGRSREQRQHHFDHRIAEIAAHYNRRNLRVRGVTGTWVDLPAYHLSPSTRNLDPKQAIRAGLIKAGRATQFFVPKAKWEYSNESAAKDLLRQMGFRLNPYASPTPQGLPEEVDVVAFALFQLNRTRERTRSDPGFKTTVLPLMIEVNAAAWHPQVWLPDAHTLQPVCFPTLHAALQAAATYTADIEDRQAINFYRDAFGTRDNRRPALLILPDQQLRRLFPELGQQDAPRLSLFGILDDAGKAGNAGVRVARLRYSAHGQAPALLPETSPERIMPSKYQGVYAAGDAENYFYSVCNLSRHMWKNETHRLDRLEGNAVIPSTVQILLSHLQQGDEEAAWAALVHRLRFEHSHTDIPTLLPQPLHDATMLKEYILRLADTETVNREIEVDEDILLEAFAEGVW